MAATAGIAQFVDAAAAVAGGDAVDPAETAALAADPSGRAWRARGSVARDGSGSAGGSRESRNAAVGAAVASVRAVQ